MLMFSLFGHVLNLLINILGTSPDGKVVDKYERNIF